MSPKVFRNLNVMLGDAPQSDFLREWFGPPLWGFGWKMPGDIRGCAGRDEMLWVEYAGCCPGLRVSANKSYRSYRSYKIWVENAVTYS